MNFSSDPINTIENLIVKNKTKSFSIYLVVLLVIIIFLGLLPIIKVDISSQSRGIIRSTTDNVPVPVIVSGRIISLNIKNNAIVQKGDTLLRIAMQNLETEKKTQKEVSNSVEALLQDINSILSGKNSALKTSAAQEDFLKFQSRKNELQSKVSQAQINYGRNKGLYDKSIIAKVEFEKYEYELRSANEALKSYISEQKSAWENQKRDLEERMKTLGGSIEKIKVEENNYVITAPISGTIENFSGFQAGSFLYAGQTILNISAADHLIVESMVSPSDIGLICKKQRVKFQLDAFNYNQWGMLEGKVIDIDHNVSFQENQTFFKVRSELSATKMKLKSGYQTNVSKGMTLTARYILTRRSLFDLLFDKVDDWLNPKQLSIEN
ncbi:MAG: HlyD family efflux transporter periplasmic adaptor subunit [Flavobacterium nitrogenifigens]|uniref:HlyD family secretion protein n=1 Tax=Flavobacterium nitrogenifigens TaxID=1617283 RepID=UPI00280907D8|nr:HlyD family efflux transporter periplasmic adaptor subunit [Flavobacterium nitrogenifigens]MDQ8013190.1 HlyD family efflux transporter periplasmic adaptor subunit [Flavobacterium nitrogenifigens]